MTLLEQKFNLWTKKAYSHSCQKLNEKISHSNAHQSSVHQQADMGWINFFFMITFAMKVLFSVLSVFLCVSEQDYGKTTRPIPMKLGGRLQTGPRMNPLNLGVNRTCRCTHRGRYNCVSDFKWPKLSGHYSDQCQTLREHRCGLCFEFDHTQKKNHNAPIGGTAAMLYILYCHIGDVGETAGVPSFFC